MARSVGESLRWNPDSLVGFGEQKARLKAMAETTTAPALDDETHAALTLYNEYVKADRERSQREKRVKKAERTKEEAAALVKKLSASGSAEEKAAADAGAAAATAAAAAAAAAGEAVEPVGSALKSTSDVVDHLAAAERPVAGAFLDVTAPASSLSALVLNVAALAFASGLAFAAGFALTALGVLVALAFLGAAGFFAPAGFLYFTASAASEKGRRLNMAADLFRRLAVSVLK